MRISDWSSDVCSSDLFQIYWCGTREQMTARLDRAKRAGIPGLIVTLDWSFSHGRDWGSPDIPEQLDLKTSIKHSPVLLTSPRYAWRYASYTIEHRSLPDLHVPNMVPEGSSEAHPSELQSLMRISYAVFSLKKKNKEPPNTPT